MYRVCASEEATLCMLRVCTYMYPRDAVCRSCALRSTLKMISKVNDVPRFEQTSPWRRWPASPPVMIDLLRSSSADREGDGSISEIDRECSSNLRGYLYKALIFAMLFATCVWGCIQSIHDRYNPNKDSNFYFLRSYTVSRFEVLT